MLHQTHKMWYTCKSKEGIILYNVIITHSKSPMRCYRVDGGCTEQNKNETAACAHALCRCCWSNACVPLLTPSFSHASHSHSPFLHPPPPPASHLFCPSLKHIFLSCLMLSLSLPPPSSSSGISPILPLSLLDPLCISQTHHQSPILNPLPDLTSLPTGATLHKPSV